MEKKDIIEKKEKNKEKVEIKFLGKEKLIQPGIKEMPAVAKLISSGESRESKKGKVTVFVNPEVLDTIKKIAENTYNIIKGRKVQVECGGVLLGEYYRDPKSKEEFIEITTAVTAQSDQKGIDSFTFTHEAWNKIYKEMGDNYPDKISVGWWHSHPGYGIFLSRADEYVHKFFYLPHQVAYVYDPVQKKEGFFGKRKDDNSLGPLDKYYLFDKVEKEDQEEVVSPEEAEIPEETPKETLEEELARARKQLGINETSSLEKEETEEVQEEVVSPEEAEIPEETLEEREKRLEEEATRLVLGELSKEELDAIRLKEKEATPSVEEEVQEEVVSPEEAEIPEETLEEREKRLEEEATRLVEKQESKIILQNIAELMGGTTAKELEISRQLRKNVVDFLEKEKQEWILESAKEWAYEHSEEIKNEGFPGPEKLGDKVILYLYKEMGGMKEIEKEQSMKNLATVLLDWKNPNPTLETRFLSLNLLKKGVEKLSQELEELDQVKDLTEQEKKEKEDLIKKEMEELFVVRKELTEKSAGRDLSKEAENWADKTLGALLNREEYVNNKLEQYKIEMKGLWFLPKTIITRERTKEEMEEEIDKKWRNFLNDKKCKEEELANEEWIKLRQEFREEIYKKDKNKYAIIEKDVWEFKNKEKANEFLEGIRAKGRREWEDLNKQREEKIEKFIEAEINKAAESPENATNNIKGVCDKIKKELVKDCIENLKKKPKEVQEVSTAIRPVIIGEVKETAREEGCPVISKEQWEKEPMCLLIELLKDLMGYLKKLPEGYDLKKDTEKIVKDFIDEKKKEGGYDLGSLEDLEGIIKWFFGLIFAIYREGIKYLLTEAAKPTGIKAVKK